MTTDIISNDVLIVEVIGSKNIIEIIESTFQVVEIQGGEQPALEIIEESSKVLEIVQQGAQGVKGDKGDKGDAGEGVPVGGTTGQILAKISNANYDTAWEDGGVQSVTGTGVDNTDPANPIVNIPTAGQLTYIFSAINSDISGYESMPSLNSYVMGALTSITTSVGTSPTLMGSFATNVGFPNVTNIPIGEFLIHYETQKTLPAHTYTTWAEVYKRDSGGTETLIGTSDITSPTAVQTIVQQTVTAIIASPITLLATDRVVVKVYGTMTGGTGNIDLRYDDNTTARLEMPSAVVDATNFVPYTGATANVDLGDFDITAASGTFSNLIDGVVPFTAPDKSLTYSNGMTYNSAAARLNLLPANEFPYDIGGNLLLNSNPFVSGLTGWTATGWAYNSGNGGSARHVTGNTNRLSQSYIMPTVGVLKITYSIASGGGSGQTRVYVNGTLRVTHGSTTTAAVIYVVNYSEDATITLEFEPVASSNTRQVHSVTMIEQSPSDAPLRIGFVGDIRMVQSDKIFIGSGAGEFSTNGASEIIAIGRNALRYNLSNDYQIAIGTNVLANCTGQYNNVIGHNAATIATTASFNSLFGYNAGASLTTGRNNTGFGYTVMSSLTTGINNSAFGNTGLPLLTTGNYNVASGDSAGPNITTGSSNLLLGVNSGFGLTTGSNCIATTSAGLLPSVNYQLNFGSIIFGSLDKYQIRIGGGYIDTFINSSPKFNVKTPCEAVGTGTVSASGTTVTGVGTSFLTDFEIGDPIIGYQDDGDGGRIAVTSFVTAIASNTSMTVNINVYYGSYFGDGTYFFQLTPFVTTDYNDVVKSRISAAGTARFSAGTALVPSIANATDTNTGIFYPAADTLAFVNGGVESWRINSAGRLVAATSFVSVGNNNSGTATTIGKNNTANGSFSVGIGDTNSASNTGTCSVGTFNTVGGLYATAIGSNLTASGATSLSQGLFCTSTQSGSMAFGYAANATAVNAGIIGYAPNSSSVTNATTNSLMVAYEGTNLLLDANRITANKPVKLKSYTVGTLPTGQQGDTAYVTDATAPTYLGALTGGGAVVCPVFHNGTAWISA